MSTVENSTLENGTVESALGSTTTGPPIGRTTPQGGFWHDTWIVMLRDLKPVWRDPLAVTFAMVQPLVFLTLFAPCCRRPDRARRCSGSSPGSWP